ncbi:Rne/Rng family ribonuclease [Dactylosporangium sp. NBC_01737]|uniref:Rne/Rng family ribonuclease n=1 Tax=Dactylosporangium sp. NBC_01737 TaxID=2975959 RepID=UPI002E0E98AB|nr:Rne/Rng family ribonuclease [Dactylosporangium sp. NBC_01737]
MFDNESASGEATGDEPVADAATTEETTPVRRTRRRATKATASPVDPGTGATDDAAPAEAATSAAPDPDAEPAPVRRTRRRAVKATASDETGELGESGQQALPLDTEEPAVAPVKATRTRRRAVKAVPVEEPEPLPEAVAPVPDEEPVLEEDALAEEPPVEEPPVEEPPVEEPPARRGRRAAPIQVLFMPPSEEVEPVRPAAVAPGTASGIDPFAAPAPVAASDYAEDLGDELAEEPVGRSRRRRGRRTTEEAPAAVEAPVETDEVDAEADEDEDDDEFEPGTRRRRRRGRRGRGRGRGTLGEDIDDVDGEGETDGEGEGEEAAADEDAEAAEDGDEDAEGLTRRRRRRRRKGAADTEPADDPHVVVKIREPRPAARERDRDEVQGISGSTRLEAKRQRRRDGREQRRTRPPILSESEFLARREAVDRTMVIRQKNDRTQIAVLEDKVLVEHYVTRASSSSMVGNVYLGRVQNVLPSMEAAFVDIGRGRNAVLYAGEVNWDATGLEGRTRSIEQALKSGDSVLVQVTKDPIGTKGARLTSHIALSGRHLVYVPHGNASGISRKLSDIERKRLRDVLKNLVPDGAGVIVRTAAEGASEDDLARDVKRLQAQWEAIQEKSGSSSAPALLYEEPELVVRVVRDLFNEDFHELVIQGNDAYESVEPYLSHVSPDLVDRVRRYTGVNDVFADLRIDEQLIKALDRRVFLPSGGSLVIDRTEAMTVIDVNTGKYTGAGGNLEETVTRNNLEAAEEIVHQLRLRDLGGIIVIDFIDMVLESNRDLVLRRLTECLGRDRTKHQVTEITSLGLVQMTRKRVGQGLLEAFSETCEVCKGRGLIIHTEPIPEKRGGGSGGGGGNASSNGHVAAKPSVSSGVDESDAPPARSSRRRGRRGGAAVAEEEVTSVDLDADTVDVPHTVEDVEEESEFTPIASEDDPDNVDEDEDESAGNGARRRTRRGGLRRRTRP